MQWNSNYAPPHYHHFVCEANWYIQSDITLVSKIPEPGESDSYDGMMGNGWLIKQLWIISHSYHWSLGTLGHDSQSEARVMACDQWEGGAGYSYQLSVSVSGDITSWPKVTTWPPTFLLSAWSGEIPAQDSLLVWVCWISAARTFPEKFNLNLCLCPLNLLCSVTVINIRMMTTIHQCQVWVFSQNKTAYYSDQLHSYHCDDLTNWFLGNFFLRLKFCSHQQWSSDFSPDEIYNETTGFCKIDGSGVEIGSSGKYIPQQ